jgi:hypothetical protein
MQKGPAGEPTLVPVAYGIQMAMEGEPHQQRCKRPDADREGKPGSSCGFTIPRRGQQTVVRWNYCRFR